MKKEIKNFKDAVQYLDCISESENLLKDVLYYTFLFEKEFECRSTLNNIIICDDSSQLPPNLDCPEIEEKVDNYLKQIYILCDTGEGVVVYIKQEGEN